MAIYVVTGGAGFIGSHIVEELVRRGETVRVIDNLVMGSRRNLEGVAGGIEFHEQDIRDLEGLRPIFAGATYAIHLAALASVARSVEDPLGTNEVNVTGTLKVLVAARDAGVKRLVFAASAAAYGNNPVMPRVESLMPDPLSPYALHKLAGEQYCGLFNSLYGLETVPLRFFNIFGPRQNPLSPYTGVLSKFVSAYHRGQQPVIFGDGEQSRDFTYVENVVDAVLRACAAPGAPGKILNVGVGKSFTLNQTIGLLNRICGRELKPRYGPLRQGDARESLADISLARKLLGYEPRVLFEEGLRRTVEWYGAEARKGTWG
jgi:UDP-N-acetylglucosamine/UDP-N-acetyl-alpha-D-glucosaminouronate 4-epimerase